MKIKLTG